MTSFYTRLLSLRDDIRELDSNYSVYGVPDSDNAVNTIDSIASMDPTSATNSQHWNSTNSAVLSGYIFNIDSVECIDRQSPHLDAIQIVLTDTVRNQRSCNSIAITEESVYSSSLLKNEQELMKQRAVCVIENSITKKLTICGAADELLRLW
mmetsp:Transcript_16636/g.25038  ORF Transcript_16636/g.25038 Transcript_16636/m.25038 type:complete len:152 (+) Transcript_16636:149-604(+)|eukprot:CAMPEP_0185035228 /NCGR_PEP_ID=MMETSP1103-20130426/26263_1 /TAXON_ID=36769 /ORGANISM="Paraphysomonas bandaiensis, Strain Caron Lab Isolate" /LENGTH=151 /DNA_ID=CAMNT_0027572223 /DNA_START=108 /DNA_END=563 /DNA_ORIENTATION=-